MSKVTTIPILMSSNAITIWGEGNIIYKEIELIDYNKVFFYFVKG